MYGQEYVRLGDSLFRIDVAAERMGFPQACWVLAFPKRDGGGIIDAPPLYTVLNSAGHEVVYTSTSLLPVFSSREKTKRFILLFDLAGLIPHRISIAEAVWLCRKIPQDRRPAKLILDYEPQGGSRSHMTV